MGLAKNAGRIWKQTLIVTVGVEFENPKLKRLASLKYTGEWSVKGRREIYGHFNKKT
jgi:hypothetical protein